MGVGAGVYMYDVVVKMFKFAISFPDEFLLSSPYVKGFTDVSRTITFPDRRFRTICTNNFEYFGMFMQQDTAV